MSQWVKVGTDVVVRREKKMQEPNKVVVGIPVRGRPSGLCLLTLGMMLGFGLLGCLAALSSDPKAQAVGYHTLKVASKSGDIAKVVCSC